MQHVKPVLQYGNEALVTATQTVLNKLEVIQNQALRLITAAVKSTLLACVPALTANGPLKFEREEMTFILFEN
jgi:hypothetical protein